jgi:hypothetical protein
MKNFNFRFNDPELAKMADVASDIDATMAYEIPGFTFTLPAGVDLSSSEFTLVTIDANGLCNVPAASAHTIGALNNKPRLGEAATIMRAGIAQVVAGGAIPVGSPVSAGTAGVAVVTPGTGTPFIAGYALEAVSAAGIIFACLLTVN